MLVANRRTAPPLDLLVQMITLCTHPYLPDDEPPPFIQKFYHNDSVEHFCYQHQFSVITKLTDTEILLYPKWIYPREQSENLEKAIATLHPIFTWRNNETCSTN